MGPGSRIHRGVVGCRGFAEKSWGWISARIGGFLLFFVVAVVENVVVAVVVVVESFVVVVVEMGFPSWPRPSFLKTFQPTDKKYKVPRLRARKPGLQGARDSAGGEPRRAFGATKKENEKKRRNKRNKNNNKNNNNNAKQKTKKDNNISSIHIL